VRITLERPYASFLQVLALDGLRIVPHALIERVGEKGFARAPAGTGPFLLSAWASDHLSLRANSRHWGGRPHLDGVDIGFLPEGDMDSAVDRFLNGEIDLFEASSTETLERLEKDHGSRIHRFQELNVTFLGLGVTHPPLDDVRIRRAIAHAIDAGAIVRDSARTRRAATGILPPGLQCYSPEPKVLAYDPDESRRLLAQAGHPGGRGLLPIELVTISRSGAAARLTESICKDLAAVGIVVRVREVSWSGLNERIDSHTAPLFKLSWVADINDPDSFLRSPFESGGSSNFFGYSDAGTDELLRQGEREMNPLTRARIYRTIEKRVLDQSPLVPLYHQVDALATKSYVHGLEPGPLGISVLDLERVWFSRPGKSR
jgi:ABC-type transport system substrate-binding protein